MVEEVVVVVVDGLGKFSEYVVKVGLNVIVENYGGYFFDGFWLVGVMFQVDMDNCGILLDFGNFCVERGEDGCVNMYDCYKGVMELMFFVKVVSVKMYDFDVDGNEIYIDYKKMFQIVKEVGYIGYIGVEYEGRELDEVIGI